MGSDLTRRWIVFGLVVVVAAFFLGPTLSPESFPEHWVSKPISLGLDLRGGVHLVYEVDAREAVKSRLQSSATTIRTDLRKDEAGKIPVVRALVTDVPQVEVTLLNDRLVDQAKEAIQRIDPSLQFVTVRPGDGGRVVIVYGVTPQQVSTIEREAVSRTVETLRNRVDQFGVAEPVIQKIGNRRILLQMPGVSDIKGVKKIVGSVAKLEFRLVSVSEADENSVSMKSKEGGPIRVEDTTLMTGDAVDSARVSMQGANVQVSLSFNSEGARTFKRITQENNKRRLAIVLDNVVYSSPTINEPIPNGQASISGGFTLDEARQLAVVLRAGALPAPLIALEERTVGPTLGKESIQKGMLAIGVGFLAISLFMMVYYKKSGIVAVCSLALNLLLVLGALSAFGATLTLPGIAGLALTIGMAVDSNVIIFERIRDELRAGTGRDAAVIAGFDKAFSAIVDSNLSNLLAGIILFYFG